MNERIMNMMIDDIERIETLERIPGEDVSLIKRLYEDIKDNNEPGIKYLRGKVENLMLKHNLMQIEIKYLENDDKYIAKIKEFQEVLGINEKKGE